MMDTPSATPPPKPQYVRYLATVELYVMVAATPDITFDTMVAVRRLGDALQGTLDTVTAITLKRGEDI